MQLQEHITRTDTFLAEGFTPFFNRLYSVIDQSDRVQWAEELQAVIHKHLPVLQFNDFPLIERRYSRNYIGRHASGFESMISRWDNGGESTIHGHPDFILYYVCRGSVDMPFYEKQPNGSIRHTHTETYREGECVYSYGQPGRFDNMIHKVIAREPALTLHIFSDDALKGEVYTQSV